MLMITIIPDSKLAEYKIPVLDTYISVTDCKNEESFKPYVPRLYALEKYISINRINPDSIYLYLFKIKNIFVDLDLI